MSENSSSEGSSAMNSTDTNGNEGPEIPEITQAEVDEQIKSFIAFLTRQREDSTRFVQGVTIASNLNYYPRAGTSASYGAPGCQPDTRWVP